MKRYWPKHLNRDDFGFVLFVAVHGEPDMYHIDVYGEHIEEWDTIL